MRTPARQIRKAALRHFQARPLPRAPAELPAALAACADDMRSRFDLATDDAHDLAMSAFSELSGRETGWSVDLELTTEHLVFVIDHANSTRRAIPLIDLVRMLGPREILARRAEA